ncbi:MAG: cell division protein FtsZ [Candidatus Zixiibacteriota bacterium]|nr:MAG: cell division protein FtsZ [candidate division Zixibacteria bacterium]
MKIRFAEAERKTARIKVIGVGGAGCNAVNGMIEAQLAGVEFIAINTDEQALETSRAQRCLSIGKTGLGAGADPEVGRQSMEESREKLYDLLTDTDMVFITAGMGGGTGTGASPIVAQVARELGILTVAVITKPFIFEGRLRMDRADEGIRNLKENVDTLILIPNQRLVAIIEKGTPLKDAFRRADQVLLQATRGISDLICVTGLINLDFADVRAVMSEGGDALMGVGVAKGENRAIEAAQQAIASPFMEEVSIEGARAVLANITGNLSFDDYNEASNIVHEAVGDDANIYIGAVIDSSMGDEVRVTIIATGFNGGKPVRKPLPSVVTHHHADVSRVISYRPQRQVVDRPAMSAPPPAAEPTPVVAKSAGMEATAQARSITLDRPVMSASSMDDRSIPAFLRKQID